MLARNPIIVCGDSSISWIDLCRKIAVLECIIHSINHSLLSSILSIWRAMAFARSRLHMTLHHSSGSRDFESYAREQWNVRNPQKLCQSVSHIRRALRPWMFVMCLSSITYLILLNICTRHSTGFYALISLVCCVVSFVPAVMHLVVLCTSLPRMSRTRYNAVHTQYTADDLVDMLCSRQASNPKDKAFALYTTLEHMLDRPIALPDYTVPLTCVYRDLTLNLLRATASMKAILAASVCRIRNGPSWVADWSGHFPEYWLKSSTNSYLDTNATLGSSPFHEYDSESDSLSLRGRQICDVGACSSFRST